MDISDTEKNILLKFYDVCFLTLDDEISARHFYTVTSKRYLWKTIKSLEDKHIFLSYTEGRMKFVKLTLVGKQITLALVNIRNQK